MFPCAGNEAKLDCVPPAVIRGVASRRRILTAQALGSLLRSVSTTLPLADWFVLFDISNLQSAV